MCQSTPEKKMTAHGLSVYMVNNFQIHWTNMNNGRNRATDT